QITFFSPVSCCTTLYNRNIAHFATETAIVKDNFGRKNIDLETGCGVHSQCTPEQYNPIPRTLVCEDAHELRRCGTDEAPGDNPHYRPLPRLRSMLPPPSKTGTGGGRGNDRPGKDKGRRSRRRSPGANGNGQAPAKNGPGNSGDFGFEFA